MEKNPLKILKEYLYIKGLKSCVKKATLIMLHGLAITIDELVKRQHISQNDNGMYWMRSENKTEWKDGEHGTLNYWIKKLKTLCSSNFS